ncbi:phosphodiesterase [Streptomyces griseorubiginosus]|uniref:phosphodiesterase n=1 Tax=Streptomyces griseorubiginosus TaxID=67304 RepID=UPI002E80ABFB|nr:phosphodiesterase [Streptomyces griseorubiginosus]WUB42791.1 phosphodiesterase [Streptomyces griseorubiginosus]WUB51310.1 phosphodiesterase [Streptomyces griseorubiginosus]
MGERLVRSVRRDEHQNLGRRDERKDLGRLPEPRPVAAAETGFRRLARLRRAPALHPRGLTCTADLEIVADGSEPWGVSWLDSPGRYAARVRLSRAAGLPRRLPDGLGLAVRVADADGPGRTLDLLMTSCGRGRITCHVPLPRTDVLGGPYSSLLPYRVGDRRGVLAAFPRRSRPAPVYGDPARLREALASGPLVLDLCAETAGTSETAGASGVSVSGASGRSWRPFGVLTVRTPLPLEEDESPGYDVYAHSLDGFSPVSALARTRRAAYRGSRAGRGTNWQD